MHAGQLLIAHHDNSLSGCESNRDESGSDYGIFPMSPVSLSIEQGRSSSLDGRWCLQQMESDSIVCDTLRRGDEGNSEGLSAWGDWACQQNREKAEREESLSVGVGKSVKMRDERKYVQDCVQPLSLKEIEPVQEDTRKCHEVLNDHGSLLKTEIEPGMNESVISERDQACHGRISRKIKPAMNEFGERQVVVPANDAQLASKTKREYQEIANLDGSVPRNEAMYIVAEEDSNQAELVDFNRLHLTESDLPLLESKDQVPHDHGLVSEMMKGMEASKRCIEVKIMPVGAKEKLREKQQKAQENVSQGGVSFVCGVDDTTKKVHFHSALGNTEHGIEVELRELHSAISKVKDVLENEDSFRTASSLAELGVQDVRGMEELVSW